MTKDSSATPLNTIQVDDVSTFQIGEIQIPTLEPSGPTPEVSSSHEQVLESWRSLFQFPAATHQETEAPNSSDPHPRFRQETLLPIDTATNLPFGNPLRKKTKGLKRLYYNINPNGISEYRDFLDLCEMLQSFRDIKSTASGPTEAGRPTTMRADLG